MTATPLELAFLEIGDVPRSGSDAQYVLVSRQAPSKEHEQAAG